MGTTESTLETVPSDSVEAWQYVTKNAETVLKINGKTYKVSPKLDPQTTLNTFIRDHAHLRGTKFMCYEGGCGSCVVTVKTRHPFKMKKEVYAVNSCLIPVFACNGWEITTVEGIGNRKIGYNAIQSQLAKKNGSQCGYCSPGMVMNMYSLLEGKGKDKVTKQEVEDSFGGNTCRCTGYRPILDAFKSLANDVSSDFKQDIYDIEELSSTKLCPRTGQKCLENIDACANQLPLSFQASGGVWYHPTSVPEIFNIFNSIGDKSYMLVGGNTAHGVYRRGPSDVYINIGNVPELKAVVLEPNLILGGNLSLNETKALFNKLSKANPSYAYLKVLAEHLDLVANVPVRNAGTLAGNLSLKHQHRDFPSDVFLMLETVGATLQIEESGDRVTEVNMMDFLDLDMNKKVIRSVSLPKIDGSYSVRTLKIMPVAQNSRAIVNAGFKFQINKNQKGKVLTKPRILYGGINPEFVHASKMETYLNGKDLFDLTVLQAALKVLDTELRPDYVLPDATPAYRKRMAEALFYKFVLGLSPPGVAQKLLSGGKTLERPLSSGKQDYGTDKSVWPLNQPVPKLEALVQCSGEAEYVNDIPAIPGELYAAFVLTTEGQGNISSVDTSEALDMPGVITYVDVKDIPGKNTFIKPGLPLLEAEEEIFCSGSIKYNGQSVGLIVAETRQTAIDAAQKVKINYTDVKKPITYIRDALNSGDETRFRVEQKAKDVTIPGDPAYVIKGALNFAAQYHYAMELQTTVCVPIEDGMDVYPSSQWMDLNQVCIAQALGLKEKSINIKIRRVGGAYGSKISRATLIATACAVAAYKLNKPVRLIMTMEVNMMALGKRNAVAVDYEVYVDKNGKIECLKADLAEDAGSSYNEPVSPLAVDVLPNCYDNNNWGITGKAVRTDTPSMTYCRAPGSAEAIASIEFIMEHIAKVVKKDPNDVRMINMATGDNPIPQLIKDLKETADYESRKKYVNEFNTDNRWRKRGISVVPMRYPLQFLGLYHALVSIYAQDGTVAVAHGGIEMGQGINTKVAQVVAHTLGIPLEFVSIKPSTVLTAPNDFFTAGSITSETASYAAMMCCKELLERMEPIKKTLNDPTWQEWVLACYQNSVDLCATYMFSTKEDVKDYFIYGVTIAEIELDLLTGQHQIIRVDILEDAGRSISPEIDIGQVEGAFIMGLGYWLLEYVVYKPENGELLTNRSWNYKTPGAKDIPIDLRVYLRRNAPNPLGVLRSKATGEPPLCMTCSLPIAMRYAINEARKEAGLPDEWYPMDYPTTTERAFLNSKTNIDLFTL